MVFSGTKRISLACILAASCIGIVPMNAVEARADVRIATVDIARILNESAEATSKKKELDAMSQDAKKKADERRKGLQAMETKLKEKKVAEDSKEAEGFREEAKDYARFIKDTEDDLKKRFVKLNKEMSEKALSRVSAYAKENKIDIVLDKSEKYRGPVLFGNPGIDITDAVLKRLNG